MSNLNTPQRQIIKLLATSDEANINLAVSICKSQRWDIKDIIAEYHYPDVDIHTPQDFKRSTMTGDFSRIELYPQSITTIFCKDINLTNLATLRANDKITHFFAIGCSRLTDLSGINVLTGLKQLVCRQCPDLNSLTGIETLYHLERLDCSENPLLRTLAPA